MVVVFWYVNPTSVQAPALIMLSISASLKRAIKLSVDPFTPLDKEMRKDLARLVERQHTAFQIPLQIVSEKIVDPTDAGPVSAKAKERKRKPEALDSLVKALRR